MIVESETLFLSELGPSPTGSKEQFVEELRGMMPFTSDQDYKALSACIQYFNLLNKDKDCEFLLKKPEYQFGKWLVKTLYEKKRMEEEGTIDSFARRIMNAALPNIRR